MKIIRSGTFETNSSSTHSMTLMYSNEDTFPLNMDRFRGKTYVYKEFGYDFSMTEDEINDMQSKLNLVCDHLVRGRKKYPCDLDTFIRYLKNIYDITIEINSKYPLEGRDSYISTNWVYDDDDDVDYDDDYVVNKEFDELNEEELTYFIFCDKTYINIRSGMDY